jgi:hypothetical protein
VLIEVDDSDDEAFISKELQSIADRLESDLQEDQVPMLQMIFKIFSPPKNWRFVLKLLSVFAKI